MRSKYRVVVVITFFIAMLVGMLFMSTGGGTKKPYKNSGVLLEELEGDNVVKVRDEELLSLFTHYYSYSIAGDMDGLEECVSSIRMLNKNTIMQRYQYIEKIDNLTCYAAPAVEPDFYIVYVSGDMHIREIKTPAPTLSVYLVAKTFDDRYVVYVSAVPEEEAIHLDDLNNSENVRKLTEQVNQDLEKAVQKDAQLADFVQRLQEASGGNQ
ncbi:MAG: hypothetical protein IJ744_00350 [Lachnospiraceae bacterium]|nr:hypothetical protein [Lachnospiraceae bacterium]